MTETVRRSLMIMTHRFGSAHKRFGRSPMRRAVSVAVAVAALLLVAGQPAHAATARQPILFVHGYDSNGTTWNTMVANFRANGYTDAELFPISYNTRQGNAVTAQQLVGIVEDIQAQTGWATIDIVTHSMGGLSSRYYLRNLGGTGAVDEWVSLGGPNHGTNTAKFCFDVSCKEMRPRSQFLSQLNSGDETPGAVRYRTWGSPCDVVINPDSSVRLTGAANTTTACLGHSDLQNNSTVFGQVLAFVIQN
jgi:triacylglycerol lipase